METHWRTLIKTFSWRIIAISVTVFISYAWLEDFKASVMIGITANSIKMIAYYIHERFWNGIGWGKIASGTSKKGPATSIPSEANLKPVGQSAG